MFLARKVSLAKWAKKDELAEGEIPADAVSADLRTQDNALSFWKCGDEERVGVEEAVLAIAAAGTCVDKIDVVWLVADELQDDGQTLQDTKGRTPVLELAELHVDVCRLDYIRLGKIARCVVTALKEERYLRLRKARVKKLLAEAVEQKRIDPNDLQQRVREELEL